MSTRSADPGMRARRRRRRRITGAGVLLAIVASLLVNAVVVDHQAAGAAADPSIPVDGENLYVRQDGPHDAPALVLIHGLSASSRSWDSLVPVLARSYRVIRIDLLGHGRSAKPATDDGYQVPAQARLVAAALDRLGVQHAVVIGHSTGGWVATSLAEQRRRLVTALALVDTGPSQDALIAQGPVITLVSTPIVGQLLWQLRTESLVRKGASPAFSRPDFAIPRSVVEDAGSMTYHSFTATMEATQDYLAERSTPDRLARLGVPLLVIFGERDQRWNPSSAADYRSVPGARVEWVPGAGHTPILEDPPRTAALLVGFIGPVLAAAPSAR